MTDELFINYGGEWLDVDDSTFGGFDSSTLWILRDEETRGKSRSLDLSVPATAKNTRIFNYYNVIPGDGVRRGIKGAVTTGGRVTDGTIFVTKYSGGRYSLMIAYGRTFGGFSGNYSAITDTLTYNGMDVPAAGGAIPDFGWYEYENFFSPHPVVNNAGSAGLFPVTNLGHIIDTLAAASGYTVSYPNLSLGRHYQAAAYGLILPSFGLRGANFQVDITGSAYYGYNANVVGGTLADAGLEIVTAYMKRGQVAQDVHVSVFRTTRKVRVTIPANSGIVMVGGNGYYIFNDWTGTDAVDVELQPYVKFAFVRNNEWHTSGNNNYWNRTIAPPAYEGSIAVSMQVYYGSFASPVNGDTMALSSALPVRGLEEWLDMYCNLIAGVWTVDDSTHTITIKTYSELISAAYSDTAHHLALNDEEVISVDSVARYVDGFCQHNYTRTKDGRYVRDLRCENDYLTDSNDLAEIDANAGEQIGSSSPDVTRVYSEDMRDDNNLVRHYDGELTVFFENTENTEGARHINDTIDMGVGEDVQVLVSNGSSVVVKVKIPYYRYADINELTCASLHGRNFVVQRAKWDKGVAQLEMLDVGESLPQMKYDWLNFEMPNGGDITLTRNGNPTPVTLEYSRDGGDTWTTWSEVGNVRTLTLTAGGRVWIRNASNTSTGFSTSEDNFYNFDFTDTVYAYGDTRSLLCSRPFSGVLTDYVFCLLFYGCSSLVTAPALPAMTLAPYCYMYMFFGCTALVTAPALPAMTLADWCYMYMFLGCTALVTAPALPAMTLAENCYRTMFYNCQSLTTAPVLPAMTLAENCYMEMFYNCQSLTTAPVLPAMTLAENCYRSMFYNCALINDVTMLATDISATNCLSNWLNNVAASGTLHCPSELDIPKNSPSGIPTGWTREDIDPWINFEMPNGGEITLTRTGTPNTVALEYSTDRGATWTLWQEVGNVRTIQLEAGRDARVWIRNQSGTSTQFSTSDTDYYTFGFTDTAYAYGDTRSLLRRDALSASLTSYCFSRLFDGCSTLMTAPRLDAMSLRIYCYAYIFQNCTSLRVAPEFPATTIRDNCYRYAFYGCTSLVVAPVLPADNIGNGSYMRLFYGCSLLSSVTLYATTKSATYPTYYWLFGVAATGDIYCPSSLQLDANSVSGVPSGWTRHNI